jgi:hypothetical protein
MIGSIHIADIGAFAALAALRKTPSLEGLRQANLGLAAPLDGVTRVPTWGRFGLVAFWDGEADLDRFLAEHPLARVLAGGWRVRLKPLRASGTWPGLPTDTPTTHKTDSEGPIAALTLGRLRLSQSVRFLRASAQAEVSVRKADGLIWATGLAVPPFVSTFSLWQDTRSLMGYAYGRRDPAHVNAVEAAAAEPFHHESAFIRFQPYASEGELAGENPLAADALTSRVVPETRAAPPGS